MTPEEERRFANLEALVERQHDSITRLQDEVKRHERMLARAARILKTSLDLE